MSSKVHLPSLNGIRAIAVLMVLVSHVDQFSAMLGISNLSVGGLGLGWKGVVLFFTLSGFLITYLLELEKQQFNKIHFAKFYIRRILRIWPIYYLIILITIIGGFLFSELQVFNKTHVSSLAYFLLFLGNYEYVFGLGIITLTPLWSVAVEEQFYIFWPWLIAKTGNVIFRVLLFLVVFLVVKLLLQKFDTHWYKVLYISSFSSMAIGALMALLYLQKSKILTIVFNTYFQIAIIILFILFHFTTIFHFYTFINREIFSIVDALLILNLALNTKTIVSLEHPIINKIGVVSYGIYIYHMLVIFLVSKLFTLLNLHFLNNNLLYAIATLLVITFISILVSIFSYNYIEKKFLSLKSKFALVKSSV
ncbi:MAG: acyltransferase [Chitinophagaceae bacterium]